MKVIFSAHKRERWKKRRKKKSEQKKKSDTIIVGEGKVDCCSIF